MMMASHLDDQTMLDLFDSLRRELKSLAREEPRPLREAAERIEARLISDQAEIFRVISGENLR